MERKPPAFTTPLYCNRIKDVTFQIYWKSFEIESNKVYKIILYISPMELGNIESIQKYNAAILEGYIDYNETKSTLLWLGTKEWARGCGFAKALVVTFAKVVQTFNDTKSPDEEIKTIQLDDDSDLYNQKNNIYTKLGFTQDEEGFPEMTGEVGKITEFDVKGLSSILTKMIGGKRSHSQKLNKTKKLNKPKTKKPNKQKNTKTNKTKRSTNVKQDRKQQKIPKETRKIIHPPASFKPRNPEIESIRPNLVKASLVNPNYNKFRGFDLTPKHVSNFYFIPNYKSLEVRDATTNRLVLFIRRNVIPSKVHEKVAEDWKYAAILTPNRGEAAGKSDASNIKKYDRRFSNSNSDKYSIQSFKNRSWAKIFNNETNSRQELSNFVKSNNIGYYLHKQSKHGVSKSISKEYEKGKPFLQLVEKNYREMAPEIYQSQNKSIPKEYRFLDTAFSTVTVNWDFRTSMHRDKGNFNGYAVITATHLGPKFKGGELCIIPYSIMLSLNRGDILVVDVNLLHGNLPIIYPSETSQRVSFVKYVRSNLVNHSK